MRAGAARQRPRRGKAGLPGGRNGRRLPGLPPDGPPGRNMKNPSVQGMDGRKTMKPTYAAIIGRFHCCALASRLPSREEGVCCRARSRIAPYTERCMEAHLLSARQTGIWIIKVFANIPYLPTVFHSHRLGGRNYL